MFLTSLRSVRKSSMLKEQLKKDQIAAMKQGDQLRRTVLSTLFSAIKNRELAKRGQLSKTVTEAAELEKQSELKDEEILEVIASEVKKRKDAAEQFRTAGRTDLAEKEEVEMAMLMAYLPQQLSDQEVKEEVAALIQQLGATSVKDMGKIIGAAMGKLKGRVDGGRLSQIVKEMLVG